jgi:alpha-L-rhamnosidase
VAWRRQDGQFTLNVEMPPGTRATVHLPGTGPTVVRHGRHSWTVATPARPPEVLSPPSAT